MTRKCIISAVVMFVMAWALSFVIHEILMRAVYAATPGMRPPAEVKEDKPWLAQGIRFGLAIAALTSVPTFLIYHVVTPVEFGVAIKQIVLDTIRVVMMGIVLAWINK